MAEGSYHHGDLRRALLDAAERLVARHGAPQVSLRAIAREAGVSPAAPYHHFKDRETLLAAVASSGFESLRSAMERSVGDSGVHDPLARLQAAGISYVEFAVRNPEIYRLMFSGLLSDRGHFPELQAAGDAAFAVLEGLLGTSEQGGEEGTLPAVALATWSTVHGLAFLLIEGMLDEELGEIGADEIARRVTMVLGRGLRGMGMGEG